MKTEVKYSLCPEYKTRKDTIGYCRLRLESCIAESNNVYCKYAQSYPDDGTGSEKLGLDKVVLAGV